jgi:hypothetical protein
MTKLRFGRRKDAGSQGPIIELKIESYFPDPSKLFVETQFLWQMPSEPGVSVDPTERLVVMDGYVRKNVLPFIQSGGSK